AGPRSERRAVEQVARGIHLSVRHFNRGRHAFAACGRDVAPKTIAPRDERCAQRDKRASVDHGADTSPFETVTARTPSRPNVAKSAAPAPPINTSGAITNQPRIGTRQLARSATPPLSVRIHARPSSARDASPSPALAASPPAPASATPNESAPKSTASGL